MCKIIKASAVGADGQMRQLSKEEWLVLADLENDMQENMVIKTSILTQLAVCFLLLYSIVY